MIISVINKQYKVINRNKGMDRNADRSKQINIINSIPNMTYTPRKREHTSEKSLPNFL